MMELIKKDYHIKVEGTPEYCLGKNYRTYNRRYTVGCNKYIKGAVRKVQGK